MQCGVLLRGSCDDTGPLGIPAGLCFSPAVAEVKRTDGTWLPICALHARAFKRIGAEVRRPRMMLVKR